MWHGLAAPYSAADPAPVPQLAIRPISGPVSDVQSTVSPIRSGGVPTARALSSTPRSRKTSMVRWLVMCARGVLAIQPYLVASTVGTP